MCGERTFNEEQPGRTQVSNGRPRDDSGNARIKEQIEDLYKALLEFDFKYDDLYDMTIKELIDTLVARRKGLAYRMWRQASLYGMTFAKSFPKTPEKATPELFVKKGIPMPDFLLDDYAKSIGGR